MNAAEVFTYRQYSNGTLQRLHDDLQKARNKDGEQRQQLAKCREEMERRGNEVNQPRNAMNDTLFDIPESKSPRLIWIEKHQVKTHHAPHCEESPWSAWLPANEAEQGLPMDPEGCGYGMTQDEAITDLAKRAKIKLWNEEMI